MGGAFGGTEWVSEDGRPQDLRERTFEFSLAIVRLCRSLDGQPGVRRTLGGQLLRAGTSIGANVEEAQAGQSKADFVSKYAIALKEARETRYWLRLLQSAGEAPREACEPLISEADQLARIIATIIVKVKASSADPKR
jgi:four helix bundle protein